MEERGRFNVDILLWSPARICKGHLGGQPDTGVRDLWQTRRSLYDSFQLGRNGKLPKGDCTDHDDGTGFDPL